MGNKKPKKRKSRTAKRTATAVLAAASVGAASVLGHEEKHIELIQAQPDISIHQDAAIVATSTASATTVTIPSKQYE
jgi:hypothetical protein